MGDASDDGQLRKVYEIEDPSEIRDYYNDWAQNYDAELTANGYASPRRVAAALADLAPDLSSPVLDYGCGTGLSGEAMRAAGFSTVDGADPAGEMLAAAESKGVYRRCVHLDLEADEAPFGAGEYAVAAAVGLIGPGAGPLELFDEIMGYVAAGGLFGVSFNDHALADPAYPAKLQEWTESGRATMVFDERGPHLPGLDVQATVYVLRKA